MQRTFAIYDTPVGTYRIDCAGEVVVSIKRCDYSTCIAFDDTPLEAKTSLSDRAYNELLEYLNGERKEFSFAIDISQLTTFQQSVLREMQKIPYGESRTYNDIAVAIGRPTAARAVGMACNRNPICIAIPCHRVVGANKSLVGYVDGLELKQQLLAIESSK